jgi:hypothetical protein
MNGVVITKGVELGETVTSARRLQRRHGALRGRPEIADHRVNLNEVDIKKVSVGQSCIARRYPQKVHGRVRFVAPPPLSKIRLRSSR